MTDTERTQHMTDAELLEELKAYRAPARVKPDHRAEWLTGIMWLIFVALALVGFVTIAVRLLDG